MRALILRVLRKTLSILAMMAVVGYLIVCLSLYLNQERIIFYPTVLAHNFAYPFTRPYTEVFLPVAGATLALVHFTQPNPRGVVLYLHGNADTLRNADTFAERFIRQAYDVILFDYRGYGKSTGDVTNEADLHRDAQVVYDYVRQSYHEDQIIIYGHSLGSGFAVPLAATNAPRMLILESPYVSMYDLAAQRTPYIPMFLLKYPLRSDQWIGKVRCPIYFFHGSNDGLIPYNSSVRLRAYSSAPTQLIQIDGGGHGNLINFAAYRTELDLILLAKQ
ncbi:MAG: alpha/beta fold hydrolase [Chloroflexales bacterium]